MNYFEFHIGDYAAATAHLSMVEDAVYFRLLRRYFLQESPLPDDVGQISRLAGARTQEEKDAVMAVLAEFFIHAEDGWHNKRADELIAEFKEFAPERDARKESVKERKRRSRQRRSELFEKLRDAGIVPDFNASNRELESQLSRVTVTHVTRDGHACHSDMPVASQQSHSDVTAIRDVTATHYPLPITHKDLDQKQKQDAEPRKRVSAPPCPEGVDPQTWADWLTLRKAKKAPVTETTVAEARREAEKAGVTLTRFLEIWCARGSQGLQASWLRPNERDGPAQTSVRPSVSADFRGKTYAGTPIDDLPEHLRDAARAAMEGG